MREILVNHDHIFMPPDDDELEDGFLGTDDEWEDIDEDIVEIEDDDEDEEEDDDNNTNNNERMEDAL